LDLFKAWLLEFGEAELSKRYSQGSDLWFIYYDYALKEIAETRSSSSYFRDILKNKFKVQDSNETIDHFLIKFTVFSNDFLLKNKFIIIPGFY
jgi:hypothetical protein